MIFAFYWSVDLILMNMFNIELLILLSHFYVIKLGVIIYDQNFRKSKLANNIFFIKNKMTLFVFIYVKTSASTHVMKY
jgi:hypothetical protein